MQGQPQPLGRQESVVGAFFGQRTVGEPGPFRVVVGGVDGPCQPVLPLVAEALRLRHPLYPGLEQRPVLLLEVGKGEANRRLRRVLRRRRPVQQPGFGQRGIDGFVDGPPLSFGKAVAGLVLRPGVPGGFGVPPGQPLQPMGDGASRPLVVGAVAASPLDVGGIDVHIIVGLRPNLDF